MYLGTSAGASNIWSLTNGYNDSRNRNNGNVLNQTLAVPGIGAVSTVYTYDNVNRLSLAAENSSNPANPPCPDASSQWCRQYNYYSGGYGNRKTAQNSGQGVSPLEPGSFNSNNQIADTGWSYTEANSVQRGNVTQQKGGATFAYDGENRQTAYCPNDSIPANCTQTAGNGRTLYFYDGLGHRVMTQGSTGTNVFVYDAAGNLAAEYATQPPPALCATCYLTTDHLGSTRVMTDQNGCAVFRQDYLPFGETILPLSGSPRLNGTGGTVCATNGYQASTNPRLLFGGEPLDNETGLDYFGARYFSGAQGRFTSPDEPLTFADPQNPQSWNLYSYGLNNPLLYSDADGHEPCVNGVNPENGNICTTVTETRPPDTSWFTEMFLRSLVTTVQVAQQTQQVVQPVVDWFSQPRNPMCMAGYAGAGATIGGFAGGGVGALGFAGGPVGLATTPTFSAGGAALGGGIGGLGGMIMCASGTGSSSGGGGGGFKRPKPGLSGKEAASDVPSWAKGQRPLAGEPGKKFAERLLDAKYGRGNYPKGPGSEFNKIQKWGDRAFE